MAEDYPELKVECYLGKISDTTKWSAAIIIQGPFIPSITEKIIKIFLERNPKDVLIIVSTYSPEDEKQGRVTRGTYLSPWEKDIVIHEEGEHVGRLVYIFVQPPSRQESPDFWSCNQQNKNLQRLTTFAGLKLANELGIPFSLKCRSDGLLGKPNVTKDLREEVLRYPLIKGLEYSSVKHPMKGRIIISEFSRCGHGIEFNEYHVGDQWFFGYTTDLMRYFDMHKDSFWFTQRMIPPHRGNTETDTCLSWLKNIGLYSSDMDFKELLSRYMIVGDDRTLEFLWFKYRLYDFDAYMREGSSYLKNHPGARQWYEVVKHEQWIKWMRQEASHGGLSRVSETTQHPWRF